MENVNAENLSFEQALQRLEEIVEKLSGQTNSLDEMLKLYAEGVEYLKLCQEKLSGAEAKIKVLSEGLPGKEVEVTNGP